MEKITQEKLNEILDLHKKWINSEDGGKCANLCNAALYGADLSNANLRGADLYGADLRGADLSNANLCGADLYGADLSNADLYGADLYGADLRGADLRGADLSNANLYDADLSNANLYDANLYGADLRGADLSNANLSNANLYDANLYDANLSKANLTRIRYNNKTLFFALQCPEEDNFIGYKKVQNKIVKLLITKDAKRSSATTRKCRCSKAKVLSITELDGSDSGLTSINSKYDPNFTYRVGEIVEVSNFDEDRWNECSTGIHFFITRDEAVQYN